jgi:hypothetical protein
VWDGDRGEGHRIGEEKDEIGVEVAGDFAVRLAEADPFDGGVELVFRGSGWPDRRIRTANRLEDADGPSEPRVVVHVGRSEAGLGVV